MACLHVIHECQLCETYASRRIYSVYTKSITTKGTLPRCLPDSPEALPDYDLFAPLSKGFCFHSEGGARAQAMGMCKSDNPENDFLEQEISNGWHYMKKAALHFESAAWVCLMPEGEGRSGRRQHVILRTISGHIGGGEAWRHRTHWATPTELLLQEGVEHA